MTDTPELRTSPDGRVAQKIPAHVVAVSNEGQRHLGWLAWEWPEGRLTAALLSDDDVADWTPLAALPTPPAEASREEIAAELDRLVEQNREWRSTSKGFLAAERAVHDYWTTKLTRRAVELRREATDG